VLSEGIPKHVDEIERLCARAA